MACYVLKFDGVAEDVRIPASSEEFNLATFAKDLQALSEKEQFELKTLKENTSENQPFDSSKVLFYSGGAKGADTMWEVMAKEYSLKTRAFLTTDISELSPEDYKEIDSQYQEVINKLHLNRAQNDYVLKLLQRSMLQANNADSIFSMAPVNPDLKGVSGGTNYAIQRGIILKKPIYNFDFVSQKWYNYDYNKDQFVEFNHIPLLSYNAALIGSRELEKPQYNLIGKQMMHKVFDKFMSERAHLENNKQKEQQIDSKDTSLVITGRASETAKKAKELNGIDTLRHPDENGMHFGNPFSHSKYSNVQIVVPTVKQAVINFEKWLRGEDFHTVEPKRRSWIVEQIKNKSLFGKPLVYYTNTVPDNSYGRSTYDYYEAPNHAHILLKLINEYALPKADPVSVAIKNNDWGTINTTIQTLESDNSELSKSEKKSIKDILGDTMPRVLVASEHTDPVFHAKKIKELVNSELAKAPKDRSFHMMYIITKHDGLPLKELAQLKIPKFFHFSITSLGGTKYEPGVMKMDDMLDRIEKLIQLGDLNPNLCTIRIDPVIPGVTTKENIQHIIERGISMGIKQYKFSIMDSYGYTSTREKCETNRDRYIVSKMTELGYDWDTYYGRKSDGTVNFDAKEEYIEDYYRFFDNLAEQFKIFINTCGEKTRTIPGLKHIKTLGCVNVESMNAAFGTKDIAYTAGEQRQECSCYGNKIDALKYNDKCASSCIYCYAKHNGDRAVNYYNEDGTIKNNRFTQIEETPIEIDYSGQEDNKFEVTYKTSSETINNLNRYLNIALEQTSNADPIKQQDLREALSIIKSNFNNLGIQMHILDNDSAMEQIGLPNNTEAVVKDGEIYVNLSRASVSSPIHEFMHLVFAVMKQDNFEEFTNIMNGIRGISDFQKILQEVQMSDYYNNLIESDQLEEAFVRYLSAIIDQKVETNDEFELFYDKFNPVLNEFISKTFNVPHINDLLSFLQQPFANITKYGSELFVKKDSESLGFSGNKYKVDISGKIMQFIQDNMNKLIQEGECK